MSFIVTARKYRPSRFSEVIGQEHITETLKNAISTGRIAHAYLLTGPRGVGKTTTARILAKAVNCLNVKDGEPCNECEICLTIQNGQLMDIIEMDAASNRGIDEIRTLREAVKYSPTQGKYKVYIIDEVHMLTRESFNAFLKTLEEPPSHTVFIFATTDVHKVPSTIISRCQRYDFRRIPLNDAKKLLKEIAKKEGIKIDDKALTMIAKKSLGGMRDAESFFDQAAAFCGDKIDYETTRKIFNMIDDMVYFRISDAILSKDFNEAFEITKTIYNNGWDFPDFVEGLIDHFRNITTVLVSTDPGLIEAADEFKEMYRNYMGKFSEGDMLRILAYLTKFSGELKYSQNQKLRTEVALLHIIGIEKSETISNLINEFSKGLNSGYAEHAVNTVSSVNPALAEAQTGFAGFISLEKESGQIFTQSSEGQVRKGSEKKIPETHHITLAPETSSNITSVDLFRERWPGFISSVSGETTTVFSHLLETMKPVEIHNNQMQVEIDDELGKGIFEKNKNLLTQKCFEYFGHKLTFSCVVREDAFRKTDSYLYEPVKSGSPDENSPVENKDTNTNNKQVKSKKTVKSKPHIKAIMDELGGEEIFT